jgi:hypothetical protein
MHNEMLLKNTEHKAPTDFLNRLAHLFSDIEAWVEHRNLRVARSKIPLNEEAYGAYDVEKLSIFEGDGQRVGEVLPVGASVIGAMGRVDLAGPLAREILVYLDRGGPCITKSTTVGNHSETQTVPLYRGVEEAGWYWIESRKLSRARKLDEALFLDLLAEVSDYECR